MISIIRNDTDNTLWSFIYSCNSVKEAHKDIKQTHRQKDRSGEHNPFRRQVLKPNDDRINLRLTRMQIANDALSWLYHQSSQQ